MQYRKKKVYNYMSKFTIVEIEACPGLVLYAGADLDNFPSLDDLWDPIDGKPIYKAVMSRKRFAFFLRAVRFDNYRDRTTRLPENRLAVSDMCNEFNSKLSQYYISAETLTVDEQLLGYRGRIPGRTYILSKPRKYGQKIFWLCEADSGYALNSHIYTGKEGQSVHRELGKHVVLELYKFFVNTGCEIVTDNFFTSHSLALDLLEKKLALLGTIRSLRK